MAFLDFSKVIVLEEKIGSYCFYELELPNRNIKVDLYPTIDMNNPEEVRKSYNSIVEPLQTELEKEGLSFFNARELFNHPLYIQPGLLPKKRLEQLISAYPISKSVISSTIHKYSIIGEQASLMNNNPSLVSEVGAYVKLLNTYAPELKAKAEEVMSVLDKIGDKLDPKVKDAFYLYN